MVRPTPSTEFPTKAQVEPAPILAPEQIEALSDPQERARAFLELLGRSDHPDAQTDPVYAMYQVAVDYHCSAHGYRDLYLSLTRST